MRKYIFSQIVFIIIGILPVMAIDAQINKVKFKVKAEVSDSVLAVGQQFVLQFSVESKGNIKFELPDIAKVKVVSGPQKSTSTSTNIFGGTTETKTEQIFSYVLEATAKGSTSIPAVVFKADSAMSFSHPIALQITAAQKQEKQKSQSQDNVSDDAVFVDVQCNSRTIAAQDSMLITYRIYSTYDLQDILDVQEPTFKGYKARKLPVNRMTRRQGWDILNGIRYTTLNWYQYVIKAPAKQGEITIPQIKLKVSVRIPDAQQASRNPFDPFGFFSQPTYHTVDKIIVSPTKKIKVGAAGSSKQNHDWDYTPQQKQRQQQKTQPKQNDSLLKEL